MPAQKRSQDDSSQSMRKSKKSKPNDAGGSKGRENAESNGEAPKHLSKLVSEEVDFPRGGGTSFTPLEVRNLRAEAAQEADQELFKSAEKKAKRPKRKSDAPSTGKKSSKADKDQIRIEQLNYKRLNVGMRILAQIISVHPLALIVSLPNQLLAHVPITEISSQFTSTLEASQNDDEEEDEEKDEDEEDTTPHIPDLLDMFKPGQYVRAIVSTIHIAGSTSQDLAGLSRSRDPTTKASRRVELSLMPTKVNAGVQKADVKPGFTMTGAIKSIEDHGYILDTGIPDLSGFLSKKDAEKAGLSASDAHLGRLLDLCVTKMSGNGRTCNVAIDSEAVKAATLSEVNNVTSVLPGALVHSLITNVSSEGLNLQMLGFFDGTIDAYHLPPDETYKTGQKVRCRVLYDIASTPPRFALSLSPHTLSLDALAVEEKYPLGTVLEQVKVKRVEPERGLVVEVAPSVDGYVHISHVSDGHVPSLSASSGSWKVGSLHRARVTGYFQFDGLLQLTLRPSILEQKHFLVSDARVGEIIKGTVKVLNDAGLFVSLSGNVDGIVWPNHYADIALKHPEKRFKVGGPIKCRVLKVDPERKRIVLTAKKTLIESTFPVLATIEDAQSGQIVHATVQKATDKALVIEFYNNLKGIVTAREAIDTSAGNLSDIYPAGRVIKVRILSIDMENKRIMASIRQASSAFKSPTVSDVSGIDIGAILEGTVVEIHPENILLTLLPSETRALMSIKNLANHRGIPVAQVKSSLKAGEKLLDLVVVSKNPEKGFVIVSNKPKSKPSIPTPKTPVSMDTVEVGSIVGGRVTRHTRHGAHLKITAAISGSLHPTDTSDNYESGTPFPAIDSLLKAVVIAVDRQRKLLTLSTRHSRMHPESEGKEAAVIDREISAIDDLKVGDSVRGFVKSVSDSGLFVTIARNVDARVQIKELFDEYIKDWKPRFEANQLVKGRILSIDPTHGRVEMTLRSGDLKRTPKGLSFSDLKQGQIIEGRVKKVEEYGLFIELDGSKLSGLCHKSELSDNKEANVTVALRSFQEGDRVKAIILSLNPEKQQMSLGLKPSYFADLDADMEDNESGSDGEDADDGTSSMPEHLGDGDDDVDEDTEGAAESDSDAQSIILLGNNSDDEDEDDDEAMNVDIPPLNRSLASNQASTSKTTSIPSLSLHGGFQWSGNAEKGDDSDFASSSDEEDEGDNQGKRKKKHKRKEIEQDLTATMHTKMPESNADFERVLLGSPNSSFIWIQYMSFQLQMSEIDKAREIGKRALGVINFREEQEKLNVWIALLNLENVYGTDESLETTFKDAARHNDSKTVHLRLANIFDQTEKFEKAEAQYQRTCKKFSQSSKVWTLFGEHYFRRGELEQARKLLPRSLQSLEKRKHLKTISRFAQMEYKLGDAERGKTIFEGIVDSHPKRWDLWSIYIDMEASQSNIQSIRNLFTRVLAIKMTSHKAKAFFKKWLSIEQRIGDEEGVENVKQRAIAWTQNAAASSSTS